VTSVVGALGSYALNEFWIPPKREREKGEVNLNFVSNEINPGHDADF
jgi:hypothetical protein